MKTAIFLQARMGSTRLPGKVLKEICGKPVLSLIMERLQRCHQADLAVIVTTTEPGDDAIAALAEKFSVPYFRGSENNVLDRFYQAAQFFKVDTLVRTTADCPFLDPALIDFMIDFFKKGQWDYVSNTLRPTYPDGLDAEVFSFQALSTAWREAIHPRQKEHVTPYFYENPDKFRLMNIRTPHSRGHLRWVIDKPEDFVFVKAIYEKLYPGHPAFTTQDMLDLLQRDPELNKLSPQSLRNEAFFKNDSRSQNITWEQYIQEILDRKGCELNETVCKI